MFTEGLVFATWDVSSLLSVLWYDLMVEQTCPILCNNHRRSLTLN